MKPPTKPRPNLAVAATPAYAPPHATAPIDLRLDGNEGPLPPPTLLQELAACGPELLRRYPDAGPLEALLARRHNLAPDRVLVTAGADEALDRICRAFLSPGRKLILPEPSFEMLRRYPLLLGAEIQAVPWPQGPFPTDAVLAHADADTAAIAIVSPNNPTGATASAADLRTLAEKVPQAILIVDHAYVEYGGEDLTPHALELAGAIVVRSLSKAHGCAGLRVGYALAQPEVIGWLRAAGSPYSVAAPSLALAAAHLERADPREHIAEVRTERGELCALLEDLGTAPLPSAANFVLTRCADPSWLARALAGLGIGVRVFPNSASLVDAVRITCPGNRPDFERLCLSLRTALAPKALLLDMDGVLADVSGSYREAIRRTAQDFGVTLEPAEIAAAKTSASANDDWELTHRLLAARGVEVPLAKVTRHFEDLYQGTPDAPGLFQNERPLMSRALLERLAKRLPLAIVTGRPRRDAARFLQTQGIAHLFATCICKEDAKTKPDPGGVGLALQRLGTSHAWMLGDTADDLHAARGAAVLPIGVTPPGDEPEATRRALLVAGAAQVLANPEQIQELLP